MNTTIDSVTVRALLGPLGQFITNLLGKHGIRWWESFQSLLKKSLFTTRYDMTFDPQQFCWQWGKPQICELPEKMGPAEILRFIASHNLRMGTVEELISYMATSPEDPEAVINARVFAFHGPHKVHCCIGFSKDDFGGLELSIWNNQDTAKWNTGCKFLTFPVKL